MPGADNTQRHLAGITPGHAGRGSNERNTFCIECSSICYCTDSLGESVEVAEWGSWGGALDMGSWIWRCRDTCYLHFSPTDFPQCGNRGEKSQRNLY